MYTSKFKNLPIDQNENSPNNVALSRPGAAWRRASCVWDCLHRVRVLFVFSCARKECASFGHVCSASPRLRLRHRHARHSSQRYATCTKISPMFSQSSLHNSLIFTLYNVCVPTVSVNYTFELLRATFSQLTVA